MSQLIQMRQRIKAIETIKKITHAMRLISMSSHTRLFHTQKNLATYAQQIDRLFHRISMETANWAHPALYPKSNNNGKTLYILIGSQKGLCGSFNNLLFKTFLEHAQLSDTKSFEMIIIGKKMIEIYHNDMHIKTLHANKSILFSNDIFSQRSFQIISKKISDLILGASPAYQSVEFWSNQPESFFIQKPHKTIIVPVQPITTYTTQSSEYIWEYNPADLLDALVPQYINAQIQQLLVKSLHAEHAARFISMDNSTRNAKNLLETTRLHYNKIRQAKITKELTELTGGY